jgi:hypothetical protein
VSLCTLPPRPPVPAVLLGAARILEFDAKLLVCPHHKCHLQPSAFLPRCRLGHATKLAWDRGELARGFAEAVEIVDGWPVHPEMACRLPRKVHAFGLAMMQPTDFL